MNDTQMKAIATQISRMSPSELNALATIVMNKAINSFNTEIAFPMQVLDALTRNKS